MRINRRRLDFFVPQEGFDHVQLLPLHAHLLRHTFGNHYIRVGGLKYLSKILGHSRIDTTARFYTDPDFPDIQAEHRRACPTAQMK